MMRSRSALLLAFALASIAQEAPAAVVRIADGDCAALSAAAASPPGSEPAMIVLAIRGHYPACWLDVSANIGIDGAGATIALAGGVQELSSLHSQFQVRSGANLVLRNLNLGVAASATAPRTQAGPVGAPPGANLIFAAAPAVSNFGTATLDAVSISGADNFGKPLAMPLILNAGSLTLRNVTMTGNQGNEPLLATSAGGTVEISHSTFARNATLPAPLLSADAGGQIKVANSVLMNSGAGVCATSSVDAPRSLPVSAGGNITSDPACGFGAPGDRVVADAKLGAFGDNGGLVDTVLIRGDSPAVHNGLAANCEASDARGIVRNVGARGACDSGAYELGGGRGLLSEGGMNGFYYDAAADGHYVTVQRLDWGSALVIWNTFDRNGNAAWIYSIGEVSGNHIHAAGAQNLGGVLQPGGPPTGSHGFVWGNIDIDFADCLSGTFRYDSPLPNFGAGQFPLDRLAFLGDLDCSR